MYLFINKDYSSYFIQKKKIVSVAVSASRQWQMLLLAWRERDESLTWWWQDNRRSANGKLLFLGKQVSVAPKDVYRPSSFLFLIPLPPCAGGQKIPWHFYHRGSTSLPRRRFWESSFFIPKRLGLDGLGEKIEGTWTG